MASTTERIQAALDVIKGAAANIVTDLAALKAKIAAGAPTEEVLADLEATAANVQAIADSTPDEN